MRLNKSTTFVAIFILGSSLIFRNQLIQYYGTATTKVRDILDSNDLWTHNNQRFGLNPTENDVVVFATMDLNEEDIAFELSKLAFLYHWREFIRQNTKLKTHIILNLINNQSSTDKEDLVKSHIARFNTELRMMKMEQLSIGIEKTNKFRTKHSLNDEDQLVIFDKNGPYIYPLETITAIYNTSCIEFINDATNFFLDFASKALADKNKPEKSSDIRIFDPILEIMNI